jgi:hypothetical protein
VTCLFWGFLGGWGAACALGQRLNCSQGFGETGDWRLETGDWRAEASAAYQKCRKSLNAIVRDAVNKEGAFAPAASSLTKRRWYRTIV